MTALKKWLSWEHLFAVKLLSEISPVELLMFWGALVSKCPAILCLISAHQLRQHFKIKEHKLLFHVGEKKKSYERKTAMREDKFSCLIFFLLLILLTQVLSHWTVVEIRVVLFQMKKLENSSFLSHSVLLSRMRWVRSRCKIGCKIQHLHSQRN